MAKRAVKVESFKGRLRLRWSFRGTRYTLSLGLYDSTLGRTVAQGKASLIEADLVTGYFDPTLKKYQSEGGERSPAVTLSASELFSRFTASRSKGHSKSTRQKYAAIGGKVTEFLGERGADISSDVAEEFEVWLEVGAATEKDYLRIIASAWEWGIQQGLVQSNPWAGIHGRIKVPPKQKAKPFLKAEISAILEGFRGDRYYRHYTDFVTFLFGTGCRTGEAIGLRWKHLSSDCGKVWIGESFSRGTRKATKTNRAREFRLSESLKSMLLSRRSPKHQPDDLVFPAPRGGAMDDHCFRNRAWVTVLEKAGVQYRKPYNTRHTFISQSLELGLSPMTIAAMTGHDPKVLFKHYAADIQGALTVPDISSFLEPCKSR
jgi:integrase